MSTDIINWRARARKIIIYLTDANYHHAFDGLKAEKASERLVSKASKYGHGSSHVIHYL